MLELVLEAYKRGDKGLFEARVRNWMDANLDNPFQVNTPEHDLYFKARAAHRRWRTGSISGRYGRRQMIQYIAELAKLLIDKENDVDEKKKTSKNKAMRAKMTSSSTEMPETVDAIKLDVAEHVLGVLPENEADEKVQTDDNPTVD